MNVEKLKFFDYRQNNSGGLWTSPYLVVLAQASSAKEADDRVERDAGVYFDGCQQDIDCPCCGDRWSRAWGEGSAQPEIYGEPAEKFMPYDGMKVLVLYADGRREEFPSASSLEAS